MDDYQKIRKLYKPKKVKVLYIGESRPANGTFFYHGDSILYEALKTAFEKAYHQEFVSSNSFLEFFKSKGCYLEDLCVDPVNKLADNERTKKRNEGIAMLAETIKRTKPGAIMLLMKEIQNEVKNAISISEFEIEYAGMTPFPAGSKANKENCISENAEHLINMKNKGII